MQVSNPQSIRITYNTSNIQDLKAQHKDIYDYLIQLIKQAQQFFEDNIFVDRLENELYVPLDLSCGNAQVPEDDYNIGVFDSDLHIYLTFTDGEYTNIITTGTFCILDADKFRPVVGNLQFELQDLILLDQNHAEQFQQVLKIVIHEIIHILGFSEYLISYWIDPNEGDLYSTSQVETQNIRGIQTSILKTPNILQAVKDHFDCPTASGAQLENQEDDTTGSHFEKLIFSNELMTVSNLDQESDTQISIFTFSLLKDTGWYTTNDSYLDQIKWGYKQGCSFLSTCDYSFQEYSENNQCTFYHSAIGTASINQYNDNCSTIKPMNNLYCENENNSLDDNILGNYFGSGSKCFTSDVIADGNSSTQNQRCHQFECIDNNIFIVFDGEYYSCDSSINSCEIFKYGSNQQYTGTVQTPDNWEDFCNFYPKYCNNSCNQNGYCMMNTCFCDKDYAGYDCSTKCSNNLLLQEDSCVSTCSSRYIQEIGTKVCKKVCHYPCETCTLNSGKYICDTCVSIENRDQTNCICEEGYYDDESTSSCLSCFPCTDCSNRYMCSSCVNGKYRQGPVNQCQCQEGYYQIDGENDCVECQQPCMYCQSQYECLSCIEGYYYDQDNLSCIQCQNKCKTCKDKNTCLTCNEGPYRQDIKNNCDCIQNYKEETNHNCILQQIEPGKIIDNDEKNSKNYGIIILQNDGCGGMCYFFILFLVAIFIIIIVSLPFFFLKIWGKYKKTYNLDDNQKNKHQNQSISQQSQDINLMTIQPNSEIIQTKEFQLKDQKVEDLKQSNDKYSYRKSALVLDDDPKINKIIKLGQPIIENELDENSKANKILPNNNFKSLNQAEKKNMSIKSDEIYWIKKSALISDEEDEVNIKNQKLNSSNIQNMSCNFDINCDKLAQSKNLEQTKNLESTKQQLKKSEYISPKKYLPTLDSLTPQTERLKQKPNLYQKSSNKKYKIFEKLVQPYLPDQEQTIQNLKHQKQYLNTQKNCVDNQNNGQNNINTKEQSQTNND